MGFHHGLTSFDTAQAISAITRTTSVSTCFGRDFASSVLVLDSGRSERFTASRQTEQVSIHDTIPR